MTTRAAELLGVVLSFLVLALGTVALRCYVRIRIKRGFGLDDGLAVGALVNCSSLTRVLYTTYGTHPRSTILISVYSRFSSSFQHVHYLRGFKLAVLGIPGRN